jgi:hypothetical protein
VLWSGRWRPPSSTPSSPCARRTHRDDPAYGFRKLVAIAERSIAQPFNDPTTVQAINHLHDCLRQLAVPLRPPPRPGRPAAALEVAARRQLPDDEDAGAAVGPDEQGSRQAASAMAAATGAGRRWRVRASRSRAPRTWARSRSRQPPSSQRAIPCINGELRRCLRDSSWRVHVSRTLKELAL